MKSFLFDSDSREIWGSLWKHMMNRLNSPWKPKKRCSKMKSFHVETHWETPPSPVSKAVYLWTGHWRINGIKEMAISLLYHVRVCAVFRNQSLGTALITWYLCILMKCMLSPYFAHDPRQRCTESCGIKPLGSWLLLTCFSSPDSLLSCCLNGVKRESWEKGACWGTGAGGMKSMHWFV